MASNQTTQQLLDSVLAYVEERYEPEDVNFLENASAVFDACFATAALEPERAEPQCHTPRPRASMPIELSTDSLDDLLSLKESSFSEALLEQIDRRGLSDPEVYRRANVDRKLFSKIRNNSQYQPKKTTALSLAIALRLDLNETLELIGKAGYTLTPSSKADLVVMYFIEHEKWDIDLINQVLFKFKLPLLAY